MARIVIALLLVLGAMARQYTKSLDHPVGGVEGSRMSTLHIMELKQTEWDACKMDGACPRVRPSLSDIPCENGMAGEYPCDGVDLLSFIPLAGMNSTMGNDIWGWTDPNTNMEYAIVCLAEGTAFVDVSEPTDPKILGFLPTHTVPSSWRDAKVYKDHAFIISEAPNHGMQVFDLRRLRDLEPVEPLRIFDADVHYDKHGNCHNIAIDEDTGYSFNVGSGTCRGGLHMVNIQDPQNPVFAGCFDNDGYTHDSQCVVYEGPDERYHDREICFNYNEDSLTIVDVTDKENPEMISRTPYEGSQYTHQGWLTNDLGHLLMNDELDELYNEHNTRTMVWSVMDLEEPKIVSSFYADDPVIDHNLYTLGDRGYLSNYCGGLRVMDTSAVVSEGTISEVGFFDVAPDCNMKEFRGTWSNYPYFPSGTIVVNSIDRGLFVLKSNV